VPDVLTVDHLTVRLGRRTALDDVTLRLADQGSVVGLFGQNGAGKSTLLRTVAGIVGRYGGTVTAPPGGVAFLPDAPFLYPRLRLDASVRLAADLWDDLDVSHAVRTLEGLGLEPDLLVAEASKGMLEQVHLALVLARRRHLTLLDEPLAAVDPLTRDRLIGLLRTEREPGSTVLVSTHLVSGLEDLFDEVVVVHDGRLVLHDDVRTVSRLGGLEQRVKEVLADGRRVS